MRQVIIMSGVSGSGKSTYAEKLLQATQGVKVSADHYFITPGKMRDGGGYHFDANKLGEARVDCFRRFIGFLYGDEWGCVLVDNTNLRVEDISPYVLASQAFGYTPEIITLLPTREQLEACWRRNSHQVPWSTVARQYDNLLHRKLPPFWKNTDIRVEL